MEKITQYRLGLLSAVLIVSVVILGCSTVSNQLNEVPVNTVYFEVVDQDGNPISSAVVEANNGKSATTDAEGMANLRFGSVGVHSVTISASGYTTNSKTISLPSDNKETITTHLSEQTTVTANAGGDVTGRLNFGQMQMGQMYPMFFSYLFSNNGYSLSVTDYEAGEWTKWRINTGEGSGGTMVLKKAFLKEMENGKQWWQIQLFEDGDEEATYTAEILFSDDRSSIRRYRERFAGKKAQEKPVQEGWYSEPADLTEESIEGATTKTGIKVEVPSGVFTANLINFGVAPGVSLKIWKSENVPGGTVQYLTSSKENDYVYKSELVDYGSDATTLLGSY